MKIATGALSLLTLTGAAALAAQPEPAAGEAALAARHFEVRRAAGPIKIDGRLDDAGWQGAAHWDLPYEWQPGDNITPPVATEFSVTFDDNYLYAAWHCADPEPAKIRAHFMDRDSINTFVQDDHVVLMIDPFNDERRGWQFRINPLGVQADAIFSENEGVEDWSFDLIWDSAARITPQGWDVEIAIPFSQLRFPAGSEPQTWGFDVGRSWPRNVRHRINSWPRIRGRNCILCQIDKVSGFAGMRAGRNIELDPTLTGLRTQVRVPYPDGSFRTDVNKVDPGLSARWGVTTNLSLNAAVNPDFSQVEADAAQLSVNERFALFYPEKRPFFLEGVDFFSTPIDAVFTRTVVDPSWGLKLTGKQGGNAIGAFVTRDQSNSLIFPSNQFSDSTFLDGKSVTSGVLRYRRDVLKNSTVGLLYAGRNGDDYSNDLLGIDGNLNFDRSNSMRVQYARTRTRYPLALAQQFGQPTDSFEGDALYLLYQYQSRNWNGSAAWEDRDPGFRADSGFVPRVDIRELRLHGQRIFWGESDDWYDQLWADVNYRRTEDHSGQLTDEAYNLTGTFVGGLQTVAQANIQRRQEFFGGKLYDGLSDWWVYLEMQPSGWLKLFADVEAGDAIDTFNNQLGDRFLLYPGVEVKLGRHVNVQLNHTLSRLTVPGGELFEANLSQLRLVYNFNARMLVRAIVQYTDIRRDPFLFPFPVERYSHQTFKQLLYSYKLNPQTVLFVGYSDNYLGLDGIASTQTDRTYFAKIGYALLY